MPAMSTAEKLMIVGLDCVPPEIVFDDMRDELPVLSNLMERGTWGKLESCDPPITVPAWSCMMSSRDPGTLGFYGFRNRKDHSYDGLAFATSDKVKVDRLWDILSREGKHVIALGVPQTFPPRPVIVAGPPVKPEVSMVSVPPEPLSVVALIPPSVSVPDAPVRLEFVSVNEPPDSTNRSVPFMPAGADPPARMSSFPGPPVKVSLSG